MTMQCFIRNMLVKSALKVWSFPRKIALPLLGSYCNQLVRASGQLSLLLGLFLKKYSFNYYTINKQSTLFGPIVEKRKPNNKYGQFSYQKTEQFIELYVNCKLIPRACELVHDIGNCKCCQQSIACHLDKFIQKSPISPIFEDEAFAFVSDQAQYRSYWSKEGQSQTCFQEPVSVIDSQTCPFQLGKSETSDARKRCLIGVSSLMSFACDYLHSWGLALYINDSIVSRKLQT